MKIVPFGCRVLIGVEVKRCFFTAFLDRKFSIKYAPAALLDADFGPLGRNQHPARRGTIFFDCHPNIRLRVKRGWNDFFFYRSGTSFLHRNTTIITHSNHCSRQDAGSPSDQYPSISSYIGRVKPVLYHPTQGLRKRPWAGRLSFPSPSRGCRRPAFPVRRPGKRSRKGRRALWVSGRNGRKTCDWASTIRHMEKSTSKDSLLPVRLYTICTLNAYVAAEPEKNEKKWGAQKMLCWQ